MTSRGPGDVNEHEALQLDAYIEALLAAHGRRLTPARADRGVPDGLVAAAELMDRSLTRFHPSFRFEEELARRLRDQADAADGGGAAGEVVSFPAPNVGSGAGREVSARAVLVGGAIASGVSLAGAAVMAWRLARPRRGRHARSGGAASSPKLLIPGARAVHAARRFRRATDIDARIAGRFA